MQALQAQEVLDWAYATHDAASDRAIRHDLQRIIEAANDLILRMGEEPVHSVSTWPVFREDDVNAIVQLQQQVTALAVWREWVMRPRWWNWAYWRA
jgi:hypothetical protein